MRVTIRGRNLPGRRFNSRDREYENVHVGVQERRDPVGIVPGDAEAGTWDVDIRLDVDADGNLDFKGPAVQGKRGERFLYLTWGNVAADGSFEMFRRAKLMLNRVDPSLVRGAERAGKALVATIDLTDEHGCPRCARVDSPALTWSVS